MRLTLAEWDATRLGIMDDLPEGYGYNWRFLESHRRMREQYGPRPRAQGGHMDERAWFWIKVRNAVAAGLTVAVPIAVAAPPTEGHAWAGLGWIFLGAAWAKFSNPEKLIRPEPTVKG